MVLDGIKMFYREEDFAEFAADGQYFLYIQTVKSILVSADKAVE